MRENIDKELDTYNECQEILWENKHRFSKEDYEYFHEELRLTLYRIPHLTQKVVCKIMRDIAYIIEYDKYEDDL